MRLDRLRGRISLTLGLLTAVLACQPQEPVRPEGAEPWQKIEVRIPVRDGIELNTEIYLPRADPPEGGRPLLLTRTPYGLSHDSAGNHTSLSRGYRELAADGYGFVFQDIRGRYGSGGKFQMLRTPKRRSGAEVDEATDTYDTIEWLLSNVEGHNGRVGMLGVSYGGWLTMMALLDPHPALLAVSPQASPADMFLGDDFAHNGAFRLSPSFGYAALMETGAENAAFEFDQHDVYEWFLERPTHADLTAEFEQKKPSWEAFMANPNYSQFWRDSSVLTYLPEAEAPEVAVLHVAGWFDAEDFFGPTTIYQRLETLDAAQRNHLVVGPWRHGGWARSDGRFLGDLQFGSQTAVHFREQIQRPFFAHHLLTTGTSSSDPSLEASGTTDPAEWSGAEAAVFETGHNRWHTLEAFPPGDVTKRRLYLQPDRALGFSPSEAVPQPYDQYVSDPSNPVPYMPRPIPGFWQGGQALWKVADQRFADGRPDVLTYESGRLAEDLTVCGEINVHLVASTSGADADWVVKLIDVFPESYEEREEMSGFQLMIADEVFRARFRESFEVPARVPADRPLAYDFALGPRCHTFRAGHALMVQIQSTWFPLIGRNPQSWVEIPQAEAGDYRAATHRIWRDGAQLQSFIELDLWTPPE